jgi:hypothetical protein
MPYKLSYPFLPSTSTTQEREVRKGLLSILLFCTNETTRERKIDHLSAQAKEAKLGPFLSALSGIQKVEFIDKFVQDQSFMVISHFHSACSLVGVQCIQYFSLYLILLSIKALTFKCTHLYRYYKGSHFNPTQFRLGNRRDIPDP